MSNNPIEFPQFMRQPINEVDVSGPSSGLKGYVFEGKDNVQLVLWTSDAGGGSIEHSHDYDEYCIVIRGTFTGVIGGKETICGPGDELFVPAGVSHSGTFSPGYRAIDAFGAKRVKRLSE